MNQLFDVLGVGLNATDTLIVVPEYPTYAGKIAFERELLSPGGQVATATVACAALGLRTKYVGTIGDDFRGQMQRQSLEGTGVDTSGVLVREDCPNQTAYIVIDESTGERTVFWHRSHRLALRPSEIRVEDIISSKLLHIDGYDVEAASYAARIAGEHGVRVSLDVDTIYPEFEAVLKQVDYLVASSSWPAKWTGEADPFVALTQLQREYQLRIAAMTLGDCGSLALENGRWAYSAAFEIPCVDTTGAGDVFHGAFCYAMLQNMPAGPALEFSNAAAAINCTALGARGHVPKRAEVEHLMGVDPTIQRRRADAEIAARAGAAYDASLLIK